MEKRARYEDHGARQKLYALLRRKSVKAPWYWDMGCEEERSSRKCWGGKQAVHRTGS